MFESLTDAELLRQASLARRAAHDAPLAKVSVEHKDGNPTGHRFISDHTDAWAMRSREWFRYADEIDRRGLVVPPTQYEEKP